MGAAVVKSHSSSIETPTDMMWITFTHIIAAKTSQMDTKMDQKEIHAQLYIKNF